MTKYDILIVGGGPAGLSAAYSAARKNAKTLVLEKDDSIAQNIRTSGVSWIDDMKRLAIPEKCYNAIKNFRIISPSKDIVLRGKTPKSCVLDVRSTYQYLATLAAREGAEISVRSEVQSVKSNSNRISGVVANTTRGKMEIDSNLVIDASGFNSVVARRSGLARNWTRYGIGAEYECYCDDIDPETWILMVGHKYSDAGYAWIFPISKQRVRIGTGVGRPESITDPIKKLNSIMESKIKPLDELRNIQPIEFHYGFIPNEGSRKSTIFDGLMLVGDSAGQANPLVLEGIRFAIEFGRVAGEVGANSLSKGCTRESLEQYEKFWKERVSSKIKSSLKVQSRWLQMNDDSWDREVEIIQQMTVEDFLDFIKAQFTTSRLMKLILTHPHSTAKQLFRIILDK
ncbi:MAG: NAD(P)/FAD-dependent oxidoreductase [Nitrososphaeraceae archaeon]|jgi:digeranylgeranylglycerophospholipid reductase|nr:NAD(P)/FAD-dependent oxidoreductase [Nitrososphaeraceae archaeon]MDW0145612.1 NAD(P)/FAD-dependent oxidoreductase [Nitrososphaeraceae archaeon]MDW0147151.1 NAD(P)/FAD-dependent oxidoreductase [Nitrososphaeraceae archaeon]MDW0151689.1 NAD(P)/FAD-dependent oxidoreductase [Nitrososphaeraceae archaeon]MDW0153435.1 NAD(P)/FAD-dependent oxidoreductase [Nitrososphaeraceae archaeon]